MAGHGRYISLRWTGVCRDCRREISPGGRAWWDGGVECPECRGVRGPLSRVPPQAGTASAEAGPDRPPGPLARGEPGRSAMAEYERRRARFEHGIERRWGRFARVVKLLADEPQPTRAWASGAEGERRVGRHLEEAVGDRGVVLHDRRVPGTRDNIDHLVVVPSGVWVVDAKHYRGTVLRRNVGGRLRTDVRLSVGRRDRADDVSGLRWQRGVVETALSTCHGRPPADPDGVVVHAALCIVGAQWGWFAPAFVLDGVWVTWPGALGTLVRAAGPLGRERIDAVAALLATRLEPA